MSKYNVYEHLLKKAIKGNIPIGARCELTYNCNLRCIHCYVVDNKDRVELTTEEWKRVIDSLAKIGCLYLTLTGGEIFTRKDFFEIARYARAKNFALKLFTNGTLITPKLVGMIKELLPLSIEISLYGKKKTHERITKVNGSYERTIEAVCLLREKKIRVYLKSVVTRDNVDEIIEVKRIAEKLGVFWRGYTTLITPKDNGNRTPLKYKATTPQLKKFLTKIILEEDSSDTSLFSRGEIFIKEDVVCASGRTTVSITPYGDVLPCAQIKLEGYNLRERSFGDIWRNAPELVQLRNVRFSDLLKCNKCEANGYCMPCIGLSLYENKDIRFPSKENCRQGKVLNRVMSRILKM